MKIVLIEMKDGSTVIAESIKSKKNNISIKYPMSIDMQPDGEGSLNFIIDKYMKFNNPNNIIKLSKNDFYYSEECNEDYTKLYFVIKDQYIKIYESYISNTIDKIIGKESIKKDEVEIVLPPTIH